MASDGFGGAMRKVVATVFVLLLCVTAASAHEGHEDAASIFKDIEVSQVITAVGLLISISLYAKGISTLWAAAGRGRAISFGAAACFIAGWLSLVVALIGPFHTLSEALFSAHMTQHEILMLISAPLIILGRPQIAAVWALPKRWRSRIGLVTNNEKFESLWHFVSGSFVAFVIHAAALWIWHIPALFDATLENAWVHALQHASFFGTALLFWWAITNSSVDWKNSFVGVLFLFLTSLHSGILGAMLTFTQRIWYPAYSSTTGVYGLSPLEDQQLGGLIMWVPAGLVYIGAGLVMFARLLGQTEKRALILDARFLAGDGASEL